MAEEVRIDELKSQMKSLHERLGEFVTHKALLIWAVTAAVVIVSGAWTVAAASAKDVKEAGAATTAQLRLEVEVVRQRQERDSSEVRRDIQSLYNFLLTRQRQERLEQPIDGGR